MIQKIKKQNENQTINDNRDEIYSLLYRNNIDRTQVKKMCNDFNMYQGSQIKDSKQKIRQEPSLLVIYLGLNSTIVLHRKKVLSKISHNHFISLFRQEFSNIPANVCQIFTFATVNINPIISDYKFDHYNHKEINLKRENIITVHLAKKQISFQRFVYFFANFIKRNTKSLKNIKNFLIKQNDDFISSYNLRLPTQYKFQRVMQSGSE